MNNLLGGGLNTADYDDELIVISKFSQPHRTNELQKCFEESKEKLNGKLNIYLLHWPFPFLWKKQWRAMEELYLSGKCDAIGVCNFEKKHLKKLLRICRVKPFIDQLECHPLFQQNETTEYCKENDIRIMSYSPIARMNEKLIKNKTILDIADKYNKNACQIILRWDIEHGFIPIPASKSKAHMMDNLSVQDFCLTKDEIAEIDRLECGMRIRYDPDKRFSKRQKLSFLKYRILGR